MSSKNENAEQSPETLAAEQAAAAESAPVELAPEVSELEKKTAEAAEWKDKYIRAQADWDNYRKRTQREREEAVKYAAEGILEKFLPALDNFEMGLQAAETASDAKSVAQGFQMVYNQLQNLLKDAGVESIHAVGTPFDPHRHEALGHQESEEHPEGHVTFQTRKGYKLKERLLRPASVFVSKGKPGENA